MFKHLPNLMCCSSNTSLPVAATNEPEKQVRVCLTTITDSHLQGNSVPAGDITDVKENGQPASD